MILSEADGTPSVTTTAAPERHDTTPKNTDDTIINVSPRGPEGAPAAGKPSAAVESALENSQHDENGEMSQNAQSEEGKPPWSEMKTKAGKERKRLPLACIACRRKKIRCSGEKPACKHCSRSRIPCVYKVTTRKAAPRTDYMAMLDKRLRRMEERVIKTILKDETRDMAAIGRAVVRPTSQKKRSAAEAFESEIGQLAGNEGSATANNNVPVPNQNRIGDGTSLLKAGSEFLPSMEIQEHLAEVFFDCVYGQSYMVLHKPSFMRRLKAGIVPPVLILAVCAISARFSTHPQINSEPPFLRGQEWAEPAASIALSRHDEPNITILTVFLLLGLHEFGTCHGGRSWSFGGQALRMAYALQLHKELDYDPLLTQRNGNGSQLSFTDREIRRRIMWGCFLMDRFNSSGSQRPPMGNETFMQIQLPIKESRFQMEIPGPTEDLHGNVPNPVPDDVGQSPNARENMGVSAYIIRATAIWGRIVDYLNLGGMQNDPYPLWSPESGYARLKTQGEEFSASLPSSLSFTYENLQVHAAEKTANQFLFLHIIAHQNILFLNQFAIPLSPGVRPPKNMPKNFLSDAGRAAVEAAHHISVLINYASSHNLTAPFAGYCAYSASTVHIWGIFSKNIQLEAWSKENLRHTYRYLNKMKRYWGMFHYMVQSSKDRYRNFADAALRRSTTSCDGQVTPMFQYGDWFDRYPHGVSRLHWEDPERKDKETAAEEAVMGQKPDLQSVEDFFASLSSPSVDSPQKTYSTTHRQSHSRRHNSIASPGSARGSTQAGYVYPSPRATTANTPGGAMVTTTSEFPRATTSTLSSQNNPAHPEPFQLDQLNFNFTIPDQLPQLDRQFVYDEAFTGLDFAALDAAMNDNLTDPSMQPVSNAGESFSLWTEADQFDPTVPSGAGDLYQPSAWFLPFNLDPAGGTGLDLGTPGDMV
ncbi:hypothetical protein MPDQ_004940 [Monascus purpureus]|uniref:Zn(2)-C6 fungal-type domain-containing protein n=1 Tax=Monascus purpureus TaxID=5098 RepID=A0A507QIP8_MONPU|nr:hypothetical protein MPDQ_004940 [Monascus purpureus]BDD59328.1 hypothetical protein MAP00_004538 [Monascus purpureus]